MPDRRTIISSAGALVTGPSLMSGLAASSETRITMTLEEYNIGRVDYEVVVTGTDAKKVRDTENEDSVYVDYDHELAYINGTVENEKDVYSYPADEHITSIKFDGEATGDTPKIKLTTDADKDNVNDWNLLEVQGHNEDYLSYSVEPTDGIRKYSRTEYNDRIDNGRAKGQVHDGGEDQYEIDGNFAYVGAELGANGKIVMDWIDKK